MANLQELWLKCKKLGQNLRQKPARYPLAFSTTGVAFLCCLFMEVSRFTVSIQKEHCISLCEACGLTLHAL